MSDLSARPNLQQLGRALSPDKMGGAGMVRLGQVTASNPIGTPPTVTVDAERTMRVMASANVPAVGATVVWLDLGAHSVCLGRRAEFPFDVHHPLMSARVVGDRPIASMSWADITYDVEDIDQLGGHSTTVSTHAWHVPTGYSGRFLVVANTDWADLFNGVAAQGVNVTGAARYFMGSSNGDNSLLPATCSGAMVLDLTAGQWVGHCVIQGSGATQDVVVTQFQVFHLGRSSA